MSIVISIIVPCYNQAQYLDECLQSVLNQSFFDWECIIVNDGSPDNTAEIAQRWADKDSRFKYLEKINGGLSNARNAGIAVAQGTYILPLDADDKIAENYLELAIDEFKKDSSLKVVYCQAEKFGKEEGVWELPEFSLQRLASENMLFCSSLFLKSDWEKIGGYDVKMIHGLEDWEFWINLLKLGGKVKKIEQFCFFYRIKTESMISKLSLEQKEEILEYISVKHADFFVEQYGSFYKIQTQMKVNEAQFQNKIKSEKFLIDALLYRLFGFTFFGNKIR